MKKTGKLSTMMSCVFFLSTFLLFSFVFSTQAKAAVSICLESPIGSEVYRSGDSVPIAWRAENTPSCAWQIELYYQWSGTSTSHFIGTVSYQNEGSYYWTAPYVSSTDYLQIIARMATDGGSLCASTQSYSITIHPATAPNTLYLSSPQPNPCANHDIILSAGDTYEITWHVSGCGVSSPYVDILYATQYSTPGGYNWEHIASVACVTGHYIWTVPDVDTVNGHIKLVWEGHEATHVYPFTITSAPVNLCPVADAGVDQVVSEFTHVDLDGRGSYDPEGDAFDYHWEIINPGGFYESQVVLHNPDNSQPYFTAPNVPVEVNLEFRLTVNTVGDCDGSPDDDIVMVTVTPNTTFITSFVPTEGWLKTPVTLYGGNMGGSRVYMDGVEVSTEVIPMSEDSEFTFFLPDLTLGPDHITVGSFTTSSTFEVVDVPYQWNWGFQFHNPGEYQLSWDDYSRCFGHGAITWELACCEWDGLFCERACHSPIAQAIFDEYIQNLAWPGSCWGMSVASLKFLYGDFSLPFDGYSEVRDLIWNNSFPDSGITMEIRRHHIGQVSAEVISYLVSHLADLPSECLERIIADTEHWRDKSHPDYCPGVISIQHVRSGVIEDFSGHVLVPDHVEEVSPDIYRIYVYDSNRESFSTSRDNTNTAQYDSITDINNYPYITVDVSEDPEVWTFPMGSVIWDANTDHTLTLTINEHEYVVPFYGLYYFPAEVAVRDHYTFPTSLSGIGMILSGSADGGIRESDGDLLGYDASGRLHFEIANGIPICPMGGGSFRDEEFYYLPDGSYEVDLYGYKEDGSYNWQCFNHDTLFSLSQVPLNEEGRDLLKLGRGNSLLEVMSTESDKAVTVKMVKTLAQGGKTFQRVFEIEGAVVGNQNWTLFRVTPDLKSLVYENRGANDVAILARFIQVELSPQPEPPDNPVGIEDLTLEVQLLVGAGNALVLTPVDWQDLDTTTVAQQVYKAGTLPAFSWDFDFDGDVDGYDLAAFARAFAAQTFEADLDSDGEIDSSDLQIFAQQFGN